ncbi:MAG: hypothetical protein QMD13_07170 [Candidatus Bathyarchaeia archaeon]|nr:hypothetical protein [Candidatus Bathyarchaeia archaeon]
MKERGVKKACTVEVPTRVGPCEVCHNNGEVHYMVAAKLPRYLYLCKDHYLRIRDKLEKALEKILGEEGLP